MLAPRREVADNAADDVDTTWTWLSEALDMLGIGAKTASGYGRLTLSPEELAG